MPIIHLHRREQHSLLAEPERRALTWIALRLPPWVSSDRLTLLGLLSMIAAGAAFAAMRVTPWAAAGVIVALAANWFGDSLDGTVARVRDQQRPRYGFYVDHVIDLAGTAALMGGLAASGRMSPLIALLLLAGYLIVSAESYLATHAAGVFRISFAGIGPTELRIVLGIGASGLMSPTVALAVLAAYYLVSAEAYLATHAAGIFRLSFGGMGPTELRLVLVAGAFDAAWHPWIETGGLRVRLLDLGGLIAATGLVMVFLASAIRTTRALYLAEPLLPPHRQTLASLETRTSRGLTSAAEGGSAAVRLGGDARQVTPS